MIWKDIIYKNCNKINFNINSNKYINSNFRLFSDSNDKLKLSLYIASKWKKQYNIKNGLQYENKMDVIHSELLCNELNKSKYKRKFNYINLNYNGLLQNVDDTLFNYYEYNPQILKIQPS